MIDIKLIRENPEVVKENIKKKFLDEKLVLVDEVAEMDKQYRAAKTEGDGLRADRNRLSKEIGGLMKQGKRDEAETVKQKVKDIGQRLEELFLNLPFGRLRQADDKRKSTVATGEHIDDKSCLAVLQRMEHNGWCLNQHTSAKIQKKSE